jgi:O-antigen/teichoic acid export membrane protein
MKLLTSFSIYSLVGFVSAGVGFFLMPVLSHYLNPADYGVISLINTYVLLASPIISVVASGLLSVEYFKQKDRLEFASLFSSIQVIPVLPTLLLSAIGYFFYSHLAPVMELPADSAWSIAVIFLLSLFTIYVETLSSYLILKKNAGTFAVFNIGRTFLEISLTLYFVIYLRYGWQGRILSWLITSFLFAILSFLFFYKEELLTFNIKKKYICQGILFGAPLILHTIGKFVVNQSDRIFIAKMISINEAGIYNVGYTIGSVVLFVITPFVNIFTPFLMERLADINEKKKVEIVKLSYGYLFFLVIVMAILNLGAPLLFRYLIDVSYYRGLSFVFWVSLGYFFWGIYLLFGGYIYFYNKSKILGWLAIVNVVCNLVFNYVFISFFGSIGAAYASALSFFIISLIIALFANRLIDLPWKQGFNASVVTLKKFFHA